MSLPPQAVLKARKALNESLADLPAGATIAVACSGGADSLAVVAELVFVARKHGWRTAAFIIDHAMQEGSAEVAHIAKATCVELGVDIVEVREVNVADGPHAGGPENSARSARYTALEQLGLTYCVGAILLGHTKDDQAETMLLGLARGSGTRSIAGMKPQRGIFRRPYLGISRTETEIICANAGVDYWIDPTNLDSGPNGPLRSQVRGKVIPLLDEVLGPRITDTLARTAQHLQDDADALDMLAQQLFERARTSAMEVTLRIVDLETAPKAIRTRALKIAALTHGVPAGALKFSHIEDIDRLITHWHGQQAINLPGAHACTRGSGHITFTAPNLERERSLGAANQAQLRTL